MFSPRRVPHGSVRHVMRERHGGTRDSPQPDSLSRVEDTSLGVDVCAVAHHHRRAPPGVNDRATVPNQPSCSRCHASLNARGSARSARLAPISPEVHASGHDLSSGTTVRRYPSPPGTMSRDEDSDLALELDLSDVVAVPEAAVAAPLPARTFRAKER